MKIKLNDNKVFFDDNGIKKEIHPFWLRERINSEDYVDKSTQKRLFDPTKIQKKIKIESINLIDDFLEVKFNDGAFAKLSTQDIIKEFKNNNFVKFIKKEKWDSSFKNENTIKYEDNFFEKKEMYHALINFYKYGFIIFKNVPTKNNFLVSGDWITISPKPLLMQ